MKAKILPKISFSKSKREYNETPYKINSHAYEKKFP